MVYKRFSRRRRRRGSTQYGRLYRKQARAIRPYTPGLARSRYMLSARVIPNGVPRKQMVKLTYHEGILLSGAPAGSATYKLNSIFDPQGTLSVFTSAGLTSNAQPLYRDQWASFYDYYRVMGVKVVTTMKCATDLASTVIGMRVGCFADDAEVTAGGDNPMTSAQRKGAWYRVIDTSNPVIVSRYYSMANALGVTKKEYATSQLYKAAVTTNPTVPVYLNYDVDSMNSTGTTNIVFYIDVHFTFYVLYTDPALVSAS